VKFAQLPWGLFTNPTGGLVLRQAVAKVIKSAAKTAGIAADVATHAGRRTVVTTLFVDGDEALEDIARFVGHAKPATTAGYVKRLGRRPETVARRAAAVLDAQGDADQPAGVVRNQVAESASNRASNRREDPGSAADAGGP
jgi:integrase